MTWRILALTTVVSALAASAGAEVVVARWGGKGARCAHPDALEIASGQPSRMVFDLSALPKGARIHQASLLCYAGQQPREPIEIYAVDKLDGDKPAWSGKPLVLEGPYYRSFDATEAVRTWAGEPKKNLGLALAKFEGSAGRALLEIRFEGGTGLKPVLPPPPQVEGLKVVHHDGQTFLTFQELPIFRPPPDKILWIDDYADADKAVADGPGAGKLGNPRIPAVRLDVLRDLQGLKVRTTPGKGQEMPPFEKTRDLPEVAYRVYRSDRPITPETFARAVLVGQAAPLNAYDQGMVKIYSSGEYYGKHEQPDNVIGTFCVADFQGVPPGRAFYVHTPDKDAGAYYAVTAMQDGVENTAITAANSTPEAVAEKAQLPTPLKYYTTNIRLRGRNDPAVLQQFLFWLAPPLANLPDQQPKRVGVAIAGDYKEPGPMMINLGAAWAEQPGSIMLAMEPAGDLCYTDGRGTLRSFRQSKLENFPERYFFHIVDWGRSHWKVDPALVSGTKGMSLHMAIRHPEIFGVFWPDRPEFFENDFDQKWNPASGTLPGKVGPVDIVKAPDGSPGWSVFDISWYLKQDPGKDIPFMGCLFGQPKDGNHGAEYGWQDDPKGYAALRDGRQPYVGQWGGGGISSRLRDFLFKLRWDKSVPAFSGCALDGNPGNGDADEGDPWGQLNGYLMWDYDTVVDEPGKWEMTVLLVAGSPQGTCTVDITPRHCRAFKPKPGDRFTCTNTSLTGGKVLSTVELTADRWGLVTLPKAVVTQGKNRISIVKR